MHYQRKLVHGAVDDPPLGTRGHWAATPNELAYLAGFMDGEGTIGMRRVVRPRNTSGYSYEPYVSCGNTDPSIVTWLSEIFGGQVRKRAVTRGRNHKPWFYHWQVKSRSATAVCRVLLPYLRMKRPQAELLLARCSADLGAVIRYGTSDEYWESLAATWAELRVLNRRGRDPDEHGDGDEALPT
jgi:hypothetical protein